jgi:multiple sugar transport system substrate-binding protein
MRRLFVRLIVILLALAIALMACVGHRLQPLATTAPGPVTVTLLNRTLDSDLWRKVAQEFEQQNPDIRVNIIEGPNSPDALEDLYTSSFLLGDSPYDLLVMDVIWVPKFAAAGWLSDLTPRLSAAEQAEFLKGDLQGGTYQGKLYRLPFRSDAGMLYYRQDLLAAAKLEPPQTTDQLLAAAQQLQSQGQVRWGYLWPGKQYEGLSAMFTELLAAFGGSWIDPDTLTVSLDQPRAIAAAEFLRQTVTTGVTPPGVSSYQEEEGRRLFQNGQALFMRNWPYAWPLMQEPDSAMRSQFGIKPMVHAPGQQSAACQGGWGFGIARSTAHPEAAWRLIQYFSSAPVQKRFALESGYLPTRHALYQDPELIARYPFFPELERILSKAVLRPPVAQYSQASDILQRYLSAAITGEQTPTAAMQAAAAETRLLLSSPTRSEAMR